MIASRSKTLGKPKNMEDDAENEAVAIPTYVLDSRLAIINGKTWEGAWGKAVSVTRDGRKVSVKVMYCGRQIHRVGQVFEFNHDQVRVIS